MATFNLNLQLYSGGYQIILAKIRIDIKKINEFRSDWVNLSKIKRGLMNLDGIPLFY